MKCREWGSVGEGEVSLVRVRESGREGDRALSERVVE